MFTFSIRSIESKCYRFLLIKENRQDFLIYLQPHTFLGCPAFDCLTAISTDFLSSLDFEHPNTGRTGGFAMDKYEKKTVVYTAYSKHFFFAKMLISAYVLEKDYIPLNPFNSWEYFMDDMVERDLVVRGNNNLILLVDEIWTFGPISDGVFREVRYANKLQKTVKHFSIGNRICDIYPLSKTELIFEEELSSQISMDEIHKEFAILNESRV